MATRRPLKTVDDYMALADGQSETLERFVTTADGFFPSGYYTAADTLEAELLPSLRLAVSELFRDALRG